VVFEHERVADVFGELELGAAGAQLDQALMLQGEVGPIVGVWGRCFDRAVPEGDAEQRSGGSFAERFGAGGVAVHLVALGLGEQRRARRHLSATGYRSGPLFRAEKNHRGGPLRYASAQTRWTQYCHAAEVDATMHQLRHSHATAMVDGGVSLATIRKRLGHANLQTVLRYADQSDHTADTELRAWRRRHRR